MFDSNAQYLADALYQDARRKREHHVADQLRGTVAQASSRGQLGFGPFHAAIADLYAQELRSRADLLWDALQQVVSAHGVLASTNLATELKEFLLPRLARESSELTELARQELDRFRSMGSLTARVSDEFRPERLGIVSASFKAWSPT